jgi:DNA polymerase-1
VLDRLGPWLEDAGRMKVAQNAKYDRQVFGNYGISVRGLIHDTLLQHYVLESHQRHDMDALATRYLGATGLLQYTDVAGKGASQIPFDQVDIQRATDYSAEDADVTLQLHHALLPRVTQDSKLATIYGDIEIPVSSVLLAMERNGVLIDTQLLTRQGHELGQKMLDLEKKAHELGGGPFNLGSPKQLCDVLFNRLKLKTIKKTPSGAPSVDEEVLEKLAQDHPICAALLEHRGVAKLKSTYTDKLPRMVHPKTGRVHTNYAQAVAVTGRLSSTDPNLQNIPVRTPEGRRIREAFIAPPGSRIVSADYSQIELRLLAEVADVPALRKAFQDKVDIHAMTASEMFGVPVKDMPPDVRRRAKAINFGIIYGISAFGLANQLGIEREEAGAYIKKYFERFPGIRAYMDETRDFCRERGYVLTLFGRKCHYPDIKNSNASVRAFNERAAINARLQGSAADIIRRAMIRIEPELEEAKLKAQMLLQVHDELIFEVPEDEVKDTIAIVKNVMESAPHPAVSLHVPLQVDARAADNWDEAH